MQFPDITFEIFLQTCKWAKKIKNWENFQKNHYFSSLKVFLKKLVNIQKIDLPKEKRQFCNPENMQFPDITSKKILQTCKWAKKIKNWENFQKNHYFSSLKVFLKKLVNIQKIDLPKEKRQFCNPENMQFPDITFEFFLQTCKWAKKIKNWENFQKNHYFLSLKVFFKSCNSSFGSSLVTMQQLNELEI